MENSRLSTATLEHFRAVLEEQRAELLRQRENHEISLAEVRVARDGESDDEHDPEGPTIASEWSRLTGLQEEAARQLVVLDKALARVDDGSFGMCAHCGKPIGRARLDARPAAELCIDCARLAEKR
ncbi:TraR/DksA family transcriptional regulator [Mycetocola sp.]|jgi:DnaK suppressor protein|uniref:TraR/DksA family transcriptional regulator n=1 Tax=Mycetocola sp. TaxID=1871042 RepID=UPI00260B73C0|nr:TraR/DksA family transcriptional regulator [Mycetocola sp.]